MRILRVRRGQPAGRMASARSQWSLTEFEVQQAFSGTTMKRM
jgi:hypothetical protein